MRTSTVDVIFNTNLFLRTNRTKHGSSLGRLAAIGADILGAAANHIAPQYPNSFFGKDNPGRWLIDTRSELIGTLVYEIDCEKLDKPKNTEERVTKLKRHYEIAEGQRR